MLLRFVIDSDVLSSDLKRPALLRFLDIWGALGALGIDGDTIEKSCLREAIKHLPVGLRKDFEKLLERVAILPLGSDWKGTIQSEDEKSFAQEIEPLQKKVRVIVTDETKFDAGFGFPSSIGWQDVGEKDPIESCLIEYIGTDDAFKKAHEIAGKPIGPDETNKEVWKGRFEILARSTVRKVIIVDRYAVERFEKDIYSSGLANFLRFLHKDTKSRKHVTIYSAIPRECKGYRENEYATSVRDNLSELIRKSQLNKIGKLTIHLVPNQAYGKRTGDRYIRFDDYVWDIGHGLEIFEAQRTKESVTATFKGPEFGSPYRKIETLLEKQTKQRLITDFDKRVTINF